jgi:hypothetical protein
MFGLVFEYQSACLMNSVPKIVIVQYEIERTSKNYNQAEVPY